MEEMGDQKMKKAEIHINGFRLLHNLKRLITYVF